MRTPCCEKKGMNKAAWSKQEDQKLMEHIQKHGEGHWRCLPEAAGLHRSGRSCRQRWMKYLKPEVKRGNFGEDEEDLILKLHALLGNRWSLIAGRLPGRTENEVKNYWDSQLKRKVASMGIDPQNHCVRSPGNHLITYSAATPSAFEDKGFHKGKSISNSVDNVSDAESSVANGLSRMPDVQLDFAGNSG